MWRGSRTSNPLKRRNNMISDTGFKLLLAAATPFVVLFVLKDVKVFKKKPRYLSQVMAVATVIVLYLIYGR
jgi:hypothetical protein